MSDVTEILSRIDRGDENATERLLSLVYDELRRLAGQKLSHERTGHTLTATALVHEAYIRLISASDEPKWETRGHFFAAASESMRRILVDQARRKKAVRRGGDREREDLNRIAPAVNPPSDDLLALDEALDKLEKHDKRKSDLVKLRYFAGLTSEQAANALAISSATAERDWHYARAWLHQEIVGSPDS